MDRRSEGGSVTPQDRDEAEARKLMEDFARGCRSYDLDSPWHEVNVRIVASELKEKRQLAAVKVARAAIAKEYIPRILAAIEGDRHEDATALARSAKAAEDAAEREALAA